ncbi:Albumin-1 protein [Spatholobus suberectus]|nr:Albumin-1 protein [Spatholobus suberectus]
MAHVRLAPLVVLLLATFLFPMKKIEAAKKCSGDCSYSDWPPCGSTDCRCFPVEPSVGTCVSIASFAKMIEGHPN